jgi:purine-binding chemotaxis protein CheW
MINANADESGTHPIMNETTTAFATTSPRHLEADAGGGRQEFLTFRLGAEEYAIDILNVQEIRRPDAVTRIAGTPPFILGVVNLRGVIVPIVDLRIRFGADAAADDRFTVAIILNVAGRSVGIVVDSVSDVLTLGENEIKPAPRFASSVESDFITGLATVGERMLVLVDMKRLVADPSLGLIDPSLQ